MRKIIILLWVVVLAGGAGSVLADEKAKATPVPADEIAIIETKFGNIELEFFKDKAPGHVKNFKTLAKA